MKYVKSKDTTEWLVRIGVDGNVGAISELDKYELCGCIRLMLGKLDEDPSQIAKCKVKDYTIVVTKTAFSEVSCNDTH